MIGMVVRDIEVSLRFYRKLGLEIPEADGGPYHETTLPGGIRLSWNAESMIKEMEPEWQPPTGQRISLAFLCGSTEEVDAKYDSLTAAGYPGHKAPWDAFWGQRYAQVTDPDGMIVDLFCPL